MQSNNNRPAVQIYFTISRIPELASLDKSRRRVVYRWALSLLSSEARWLALVPTLLTVAGGFLGVMLDC
jgi:hypothetical protein